MHAITRRAARAALCLVLAAFALLLAGCADEPVAPATQAAVHLDHAPPTGLPLPVQVQYVCPMHPHIVADEPGSCPICGMDLVEKKPAPTAAQGEREVLYWYDPMRPEVHFDEPGRSPFMDMDLVPRYADEGGADAVRVEPAMRHSLGVRSGRVERAEVSPRLRAPATVVADAATEVQLASRVQGWIEKLHVRAVGDRVRRGQVVAEVHAPELVAAQEELLVEGLDPAAARERLLRLGIAAADIDAVVERGASQRRLPLRAPADGVVRELPVREGAPVSPQSVIVAIAARQSLWIEARVFPAQLAQLGEAPTGRFTLPGSDLVVEAGAAYIEPEADPVTQTVAIRFPVEASHPGLVLGAWLDAELAGPLREGVLLAPLDAVIRDGSGARVLRITDDGGYLPVAVRTGARFGERIEILEGIAAGARVVTSGQFLIDSEASLRGALARLAAPDGGAADESTDHSEMDHSGMDHSAMDHSEMDHSAMDHSTMDHSEMDHSEMDHGDGGDATHDGHGHD